jgi:RHS repeat-associated protein
MSDVTYMASPLTHLPPGRQSRPNEAKHLNTPRLVADATGTTVWRWDQAEPFGNNPANDDPDGNSVAFDLPLRLPGQRYDAETGLHYDYFRDYDPGLGRYPESDPIGLRGGLNTYAYASVSPLSLVDPEGLRAFVCCRLLNSRALGFVLRQRHCYFNVDGMTYGLYPEGNIGVPREGDKRDRGGICIECKPKPPCSDVNKCIKSEHGEYPIGEYDAWKGPNSNTYAATLADACCAGGFPAGTGNAPGIGDKLPAPIP